MAAVRRMAVNGLHGDTCSWAIPGERDLDGSRPGVPDGIADQLGDQGSAVSITSSAACLNPLCQVRIRLRARRCLSRKVGSSTPRAAQRGLAVLTAVAVGPWLSAAVWVGPRVLMVLAGVVASSPAWFAFFTTLNEADYRFELVLRVTVGPRPGPQRSRSPAPVSPAVRPSSPCCRTRERVGAVGVFRLRWRPGRVTLAATPGRTTRPAGRTGAPRGQQHRP